MGETREVFFRNARTRVASGTAALKKGGKGSLREALQYVMASWFPVNGTLLREIQKKLNSGFYEGNRPALIHDLKADVTLYAVFLKALPSLMPDSSQNVDPGTVLEETDLAKLKNILSVSEGQLSGHSLSNMVKAQAMRLKQSLISCSTAETIAGRIRMDQQSVYSCALIRQLGHNLLAWNYPRIYSRALSQATESEQDLDLALLNTFGFSPLAISIEIANMWHLRPELKLAVAMDASGKGKPPPGWDGGDAQRFAEQIARCCDVGERVARVSEPEYFPQAAGEWRALAHELTGYLGPDGFQAFTAQIERLATHYQAFAPTLFEGGSLIENIEKARTSRAGHLLQANTYAFKCGEALLQEIRNVYDHILGGQISTQALDLLVGRVIPKAGFKRGCLYLLDSNKMQLIPTFKVGDRPVNQYKILNCNDSDDNNNPITEALYCGAPIRQEGVFLHNEQVAHVSGIIGNESKMGVLYLEMSDELSERDSHEALVRFKAIARCLNDCLNL